MDSSGAASHCQCMRPLFAAVVLVWLAVAAVMLWPLSGCTDARPVPATDPCAQYVGQAAIHRTCVEREALAAPGAAEATTLCDELTGADGMSCREQWVRGALDWPGRDRDELLGVCGAAEECRKLVMDRLPKARAP